MTKLEIIHGQLVEVKICRPQRTPKIKNMGEKAGTIWQISRREHNLKPWK
jgi:hypothetical protein